MTLFSAIVPKINTIRDFYEYPVPPQYHYFFYALKDPHASISIEFASKPEEATYK